MLLCQPFARRSIHKMSKVTWLYSLPANSGIHLQGGQLSSPPRLAQMSWRTTEDVTGNNEGRHRRTIGPLSLRSLFQLRPTVVHSMCEGHGELVGQSQFDPPWVNATTVQIIKRGVEKFILEN